MTPIPIIKMMPRIAIAVSTTMIMEMTLAVFAVLASGCPGYDSVIVNAPLATIHAGIAKQIPPKKILTRARINARDAFVFGMPTPTPTAG